MVTKGGWHGRVVPQYCPLQVVDPGAAIDSIGSYENITTEYFQGYQLRRSYKRAQH